MSNGKKKKFVKKDLQNEKSSESTSVNKLRITPSKDDIVTVVPGTNIHKNNKGEVVIKDDKGVYRKVERKKETLKQGVKKSKQDLEKEQETIKEMQSDNLGLRAPLHYLANPDHMLGDLGNLTGFKPLQEFSNSDEDAKRYNYQSLDPSKSKKERFKNNLNEGLNLLPKATVNLSLASLATKTPLRALREAYNPIPLPFSTGIKFDPTDYWKHVNNQQDTADLLTSQKILPFYKSEIDWAKWNKEIPENTQLMKEYNAIEQTSKADGTWMKNPDGSAFQGTPEQFVQQNSENFKKAFPNPVLDDAGNVQYNYHGSPNKFNEFDETKFYSGYYGKGIYTSPDKKGILNSYANDAKSRVNRIREITGGEGNGANLYELYINSKNPKIFDDVSELPYDIKNYGKNIEDFPTRSELYNQYSKEVEANSWIKSDEDFDKFLSYMNKTPREKAQLTLPDNDFIRINDTKLKEQVIPFSNYPKSAVGNNGMFDMTNPNIYKSLAPIGLGLGVASQIQEKSQSSEFALGGNLNKQNNNNNMLNEFNEGGTHDQNPLGGIPQGMGQNGMMNTVEEGETKKGDFVYSDRIVFTPEIVEQFNLPKSLTGKTSAEASKIINRKFDGRNDKITNSTKKSMLDKVAEAQETIKQMQAEEINQAMQMNSQEVPDMMEGQVPQGMEEFTSQNQMFAGGELTSILGAAGASGALGQHTGINQLTTAADLGQTAFGKTGIDTSGAVNANPGAIKPGIMGVEGAMKGAQAGMMFGPWGAAIGGAVGLTAGLVGGNRAKKDALKANQNFEIGEVNKKISNFAFGGNLNGDPKTDPKLKPKPIAFDPTKEDFLPIRKITPVRNPDGTQGYQYFYGKLPNEEGYSEDMNSHIYTADEHNAKQSKSHPEYSTRAQDYLTKTKGLLNRDMKTFAMGGKMYDNGGYLERFKQSTMQNDPNFSGGFGFKPTKGLAPYATELPLNQQVEINSTYNPNSFYKKSFNQMSKPQISNDLGFKSKINYNDPDTVNLSLEQLQENNGYSDPKLLTNTNARTFGPQGGHSTQAQIKNVTDQIGTGLNKAGQFIKDNKGALRYAPVAMNAFQLHKLNKEGYDTVNPIVNNARYNPQYMDERALTNQINAESNYAGNALANASNGSMGALSNSILASQLNKVRGLSDAYSKVADVNRNENKAAQQFNLGVDEANIGRRIGAEDRTAMNKGAFKTEQSKLRGQIGTDLGEIGKEETYKDMAKKLYGYDFNGKYFVAPDGTKKTTQEMADMIDNERYQKQNKKGFVTPKFNPMNFEDGIVFKSKYN
jgi:hypothetical protein